MREFVIGSKRAQWSAPWWHPTGASAPQRHSPRHRPATDSPLGRKRKAVDECLWLVIAGSARTRRQCAPSPPSLDVTVCVYTRKDVANCCWRGLNQKHKDNVPRIRTLASAGNRIYLDLARYGHRSVFEIDQVHVAISIDRYREDIEFEF
jgi:hypothetical protein